MMKQQVNIDFEIMAKAMAKYVRDKAAKAGSTIVYKKDGILVEENPLTLEITILKQPIHLSNA